MIHAWAIRWSIPPAALTDLLTCLGAAMTPDSSTAAPSSEAAVQNAVRIEHAKRTYGRLFRNNSGVATAENGRPVRYGLCNDTPAINNKVKSPDLVGVTPVTCPCGRLYGVFTGYECKPTGWHYTATDRERAQLAFITFINQMGGRAAFITSPEEL